MEYVNLMRRKLLEKKKVFGTTVVTRDPVITEALGQLYDFIWIDQEHTWLDRGAIMDHLIAARAAGTASLVRVPWNDFVLAKPILDMGPDGIIFPMIRTVEDARAALAACAYPPDGIRGWGPFRAQEYGAISNQDYIDQSHERVFKVLQVEHYETVDNLDEILDLGGIDCICVGPNDLSASIGKLTRTTDPEVVALCDRIGEICRRRNVPLMTSIGFDEALLKQWADRGTVFYDISIDYLSMMIESKRQLDWMKENC